MDASLKLKKVERPKDDGMDCSGIPSLQIIAMYRQAFLCTSVISDCENAVVLFAACPFSPRGRRVVFESSIMLPRDEDCRDMLASVWYDALTGDFSIAILVNQRRDVYYWFDTVTVAAPKTVVKSLPPGTKLDAPLPIHAEHMILASVVDVGAYTGIYVSKYYMWLLLSAPDSGEGAASSVSEYLLRDNRDRMIHANNMDNQFTQRYTVQGTITACTVACLYNESTFARTTGAATRRDDLFRGGLVFATIHTVAGTKRKERTLYGLYGSPNKSRVFSVVWKHADLQSIRDTIAENEGDPAAVRPVGGRPTVDVARLKRKKKSPMDELESKFSDMLIACSPVQTIVCTRKSLILFDAMNTTEIGIEEDGVIASIRKIMPHNRFSVLERSFVFCSGDTLVMLGTRMSDLGIRTMEYGQSSGIFRIDLQSIFREPVLVRQLANMENYCVVGPNAYVDKNTLCILPIDSEGSSSARSAASLPPVLTEWDDEEFVSGGGDVRDTQKRERERKGARKGIEQDMKDD